jgi:hypothetical protein
VTITEPGLYPGLDFAEYLADPVPGGSLSSTFARLLTNHVPAKALERRRNNRPTKAMSIGTAAHLQALGVGPQLIVWQYDGRTKDGKAERAEAARLIESQAAVALTQTERDQVLGMAEALRAHDEVRAILETSQSEVSAFWQESGVWLRARYDLLGDTAAHDYKTSNDVTRRGFSKAMASFGYHQQADFYQRGLAALGHPAAGVPMRFICQETEPPYLVQIHTPDEMALEVGRVLNDRAIRIYAECVESGRWPGYESLDAEPAALPSFYYFDREDVLPDEWRPLEQEIVI